MTERNMRRRRAGPNKDTQASSSAQRRGLTGYLCFAAVSIVATGIYYAIGLATSRAAAGVDDTIPKSNPQSGKRDIVALANNTLQDDLSRNVPCIIGKGQQTFPACSAGKRNKIACRRFVSDSVLPPGDAVSLRIFASKLMALGGGSGGPTILDLHSSMSQYSVSLSPYMSVHICTRVSVCVYVCDCVWLCVCEPVST